MKKIIFKLIFTFLLVTIVFRIGAFCGVKYKEYQFRAIIDDVMEWSENNDLTALIGKKAEIVACDMSNRKVTIYVYPKPYAKVKEAIADRLFDGKLDRNKISFAGVTEYEYKQIK